MPQAPLIHSVPRVLSLLIHQCTSIHLAHKQQNIHAYSRSHPKPAHRKGFLGTLPVAYHARSTEPADLWPPLNKGLE